MALGEEIAGGARSRRGRDAAVRQRWRCARCTRPGTPPGCSRFWSASRARPGADGRSVSAAPGGFTGGEAVVFTGDTLFAGSVGGVRAPGHTTYTDLRDSIMGTLMELPPETVIHPGHADPTTVGAEWEQNPFIRVWRGLDPEGAEPCTALGEPATLVLLGDGLRRRHEGLGALAGRLGRHRARARGSSAAAEPWACGATRQRLGCRAWPATRARRSRPRACAARRPSASSRPARRSSSSAPAPRTSRAARRPPRRRWPGASWRPPSRSWRCWGR